MTRAMRRASLLLVGLVILGGGACALFYAFRAHMVFYYRPQEVIQQKGNSLSIMRVGGILEKGSLVRQGMRLTFRITDGVASLAIVFSGIAPRLLKEGQGVVAEGTWDAQAQLFQAKTLLVKHDEVYTPAACTGG